MEIYWDALLLRENWMMHYLDLMILLVDGRVNEYYYHTNNKISSH